MEKEIKGVLNSRTGDDGKLMYKVRYAGMDKSGDEWVKPDVVSKEHVVNFEKRKAAKKQGSQKPQEEKKRKAESEAGDGAEGQAEEQEEPEEADEDGEGDGESKGSRLEFDEGGIGVAADEVDPSLIIEGPRRKRKAAEKAEQSSEWSNLLAGKLSALGDSDSDSD